MPVALTPPSDALVSVHRSIERYYTERVVRFGATPLGVDWSCVPSQRLRFIQLLRVCEPADILSLNDLGCGYGDLLSHLADRHPGCDLDYLGVDLSPAMIRRARRRWRGHARARFLCGGALPRQADIAVASGLFNVILDQPLGLWEAFIAATLCNLDACSRLGFAVNFIRSAAVAVGGLYRTPPDPWIAFCERELGAAVTLVEGYGLREFTLLVRPAALSR